MGSNVDGANWNRVKPINEMQKNGHYHKTAPAKTKRKSSKKTRRHEATAQTMNWPGFPTKRHETASQTGNRPPHRH